MQSVAELLTSGGELEGRFLVEEALPGGVPGAFLGIDKESAARVELHPATGVLADAWKDATGATHAHLVGVLHRVDASDGFVLVTEHIAGTRLDADVRKTQVDAVRSALRLADAVSSLHKAGACHGAIRPANILVDPAGRNSPILTFSTRRSEPPYRGPSGDDAPDPADDAWAVAAVMYLMLTGQPPPAGGVTDADLTEIADPILRGAIEHGLSVDADKRHREMQPLKGELARWYVDHGADESVSSYRLSTPPPLPVSEAPPAVMPSAPPVPAVSTNTAPPPAPPARKRWIIIGAIAAIACGLGAAFILSSMRPNKEVVEYVVRSASATAAPAASSAPPVMDLSEVAVTGTDNTKIAGDQLGVCVANYLPKGAFNTAPDFKWMCETPDPRDGAPKLRAALVKGSPQGGVTDAMKIFSQLGWYDIPAYEVIRNACCQEAGDVKLPKPADGCDAMTPVVTRLASEVGNGQPYEESLKAYTKVINCEAGGGRAATFRKQGRPSGGEESAFKQFAKTISDR